MDSKRAIQKRFDSLVAEHQRYLPAYQSLSTYINQTRGIFNNDRTKIGTMIDHKVLLSSYATHANRIFASGLNSGMTNKSTQWFRLTLDREELLEYPGVRKWLDDVQNKMYSVLNQSNLYDIFYSVYEELGQFGTACFILLEDYDNVVRGRMFTAGEYYLAANHKGDIDTFGRSFEMTVEQMVQQFGRDKCSDQVIALYDNNNLDNKIKINHIIYPNNNRNMELLDNQNMPWASVYWESGSLDENKILAKRGFNRFPVIAPRWEVTTTDTVYGYGPGWHAIGAIKELQKTRLDKLLAQEKLHNPPMLEDDNVQGHTNILPGGVTKISGTIPNSGVRPAYQINPNLESFIEAMNELKEEIDKFFFVNLFLMIMQMDKSQMTATEVAERQQERIMMIGPALHKLDTDLSDKVLELLYGIMEDNLLIPELPEALADVQIKIEYTSILAQAQRAIGVVKMERVIGFVSALGAFSPEAVDVLDTDEMLRQMIEMEGAPAKIVKDRSIVDEIREQRMRMQNATTMAQMANSAADTTKKLSDAKTSEPSALDGVLQGLERARGISQTSTR